MKRTRAIFRQRTNQVKRIAPKLRIGLTVGDPEDFPEERNFAMCALVQPTFAQILVAEKIEREPDAVIDALLRHEIAHALLSYERRPHHTEQMADDLAEKLWGDRIYYDDRNVQTLARGTWPRPRHLPQ